MTVKITINKWYSMEPVQFCKKELGGYQKIVSLLQLYSQDPPIAETAHVLKVGWHLDRPRPQ